MLGFARECIQKHQFQEACSVLAAADRAQLHTVHLRRDALRTCVAVMQSRVQQLPLFSINLPVTEPLKQDIKRLSDQALLLCRASVHCLQTYAEYLRRARDATATAEAEDDDDEPLAVERSSLQTMCRLLWCVREREQLAVAIVKRSADVGGRAARMVQFGMSGSGDAIRYLHCLPLTCVIGGFGVAVQRICWRRIHRW